ncbi:MAG: PEP-utilizing enzyme [Lachnospiraceae bacterium]|nr:PEP-utilizing enzyme [Lachnospiraceae bacterium]
MIEFHGTSVSSGIATGDILYFCARRENFSQELTDEPEQEMDLLERQIKTVEHKLQETIDSYRSEGQEQEAILTEARLLLLADIIHAGGCREMISEQHYSARRAVLEAETRFRMEFENMEDDFMRERSYDIEYVMEMLLNLLGGNRHCFPKLTKRSIIVADELIPEETLYFEREYIAGILIKNGTYNSHGAILARLWNIPALIGISPEEDWADRPAVMDANQGILYLEPDSATLEMAQSYSPFSGEDDIL